MKHISSQAAFIELRKNGIRKRTPYFDIVTTPADRDGDFGLAIIVTRKTVNAVKRNKIKRWFRNYAHLHSHNFKSDHNYLIICKKGIFNYGREHILHDLTTLLENTD